MRTRAHRKASPMTGGLIRRVTISLFCRGGHELPKEHGPKVRRKGRVHHFPWSIPAHVRSSSFWVLFLVAGSLLVNMQTALAASTWSLDTSANSSTSQTNVLEGVSCVSASFCMSVGYYTIAGHPSGTNQTLIEEWNGSTWASITAPDYDAD